MKVKKIDKNTIQYKIDDTKMLLQFNLISRTRVINSRLYIGLLIIRIVK